MMNNHRSLTALLAALCVALIARSAVAHPGGDGASLPHEVPYKAFYSELLKFGDRPNTERLQLRTSLRPKDETRPLGPVRMVIETQGGVVAIPTDEENSFVFPLNAAWVAEGATLRLSTDPETFSIRVQVGMKLTDPNRLTYDEMLAAFEQFNAVIEDEAGMLSFAAPAAKSLRIFCGVECTATLRSSTGERVMRADERGRITIPVEKALKAQNPEILLSKPARYTAISTRD